MNGGKQVGKDGEQCEEGFGDAEVKDHDAVKRAVDGHEGHGNRGVDEGKLEAFEEHNFLWQKGLKTARAFGTPSPLLTVILGVNLHKAM